jgi:hexosaminidase
MNGLAMLLAATRMLMPVPAEMTDAPGRLPIDAAFTIGVAGTDERLMAGARRALERLSRRTGLALAGPNAGDAVLRIRADAPGRAIPALGDDESYTLEIGPRGGDLHAPTVVGALRGLETFLQLVEGDASGSFVPGVVIHDRPRFPWRGLLIDVGRHFMPIDLLKRELDAMAAVKLNVLHFHLTEDQGFRVESRLHPRLHQMGSEGNYYTQDQLRDLVRYAAARGIRVMPEFDMPGHVTSWLVGHPELATLPGPYQIEDKWGIMEPALDPTRESVYAFLDSFLGEMASVFPDAYIHIGGDESEGKQWDKSERVQDYKRRHRIAAILTRHGKKMAGWEEILDAGLPKDIVIESWKGPKPLAEAARQGRQGILAAGYYLDYIYTAAQHYVVDPLPPDAGLTPAQAALVLGGEACMWSEEVSPETIDSRLWPRLAAIAERFWSPASVTDVADMYRRLDAVSRELEDLGLTHEKNVDAMVRRLAAGGDTAAVRTLVDAVEQVKVYKRGEMRVETRHTPLTRLVDAARPDSAEARRLGPITDAIIADAPRYGDGRDALRATFAEWRRAGDAVTATAARSPLLAEAVPVAADLATVGRIGEEALGYLGQPAPAGWADAALTSLDAAAQPKAQVEIVVIEPVRRLVRAAAGRR